MHAKVSHAILSILVTCLLFSLLTFITQAQEYPFCNNTGRSYTQGSQYEFNLNVTLSTLASNITSNGFYNITIGSSPDRVSGRLQCESYASYKDCRLCAKTLVSDIIKLCPNRREAVISNKLCRLRYADYRFFSIATTDPAFCASNQDFETSNPVFFSRLSGKLINYLSSLAASDASKYSTGRTSFNDSVYIYGLARCTRDLSTKTCLTCLQNMIQRVTKCADKKVGGGALSVSCQVRYDIYPFYPSFQSPSLALPGSSTTRTNNRSSDPHGNRKHSRIIILIVIPVVIASLILFSICICFIRRKNIKRRFGYNEDGINSMESEIKNTVSLMFDLSTVRTATENFSNSCKLGEGGFGSVYKGKLPDGREIAVKRLAQQSGQGLEEMKTEVVLVAKLMHRNLVTFLGFCIQEEEKLLVYEYLSNGSLEQILFDRYKCLLLDWDKRYKIINGVAHGLLYLHQDSKVRIIHRDLKASNILLDENMNPKISDFGLARIFGESQVAENTKRIAGTYGYMAPEYTVQGQYSTKSDIFSFGVLVLEIVSGQKNSSFHGPMNLLSYVWHYWNDGIALKIVDSTLDGKWSQSEVLKCIQLGLLCVQQDAYVRPSMSEIFLWLNSYSVTCRIPSQPAYFVDKIETESEVTMTTTTSGDLESDKTLTKNSQRSVNGVTISELCPR